MGKSTLCKKMIYEFIHNNMWTEKIDRVIWFPLRELQEENDTSIGSLIIRRHFVEDNEADQRSETLGREIEKKSTRTLFILDGLDEVPTGRISPLITKLLNQPRVIITSRPYAISQARLYNLHREVETVGFYADQVKEYIKVIGKDMAEEIQQFTDSHPIIQGLARIPIKLDAICFSFTEKSAASKEMNDIPTGVTTMTELYKGVEWALWCKDIPKLGIRGWDDKESEPEMITKEIAQREGPKVGKIWLDRPLRALQHLAFKGLCDNIYEFGRDYWQPIFTPAGQSPLNAASLSFLRSSSAYTRHGQTYHFLHPTFQEFFAAQYFVEHWKSNTELDHPTLENITAAHFLRKEKYNARYDIMWRFVAGLLQDGPGKEQLCLFFKLVEKEPRDLFGPGHQRLVMHCLNEVHPSQTNDESFHKMRMALENHLKEWLLYECRVLGKSWLAAESEFPCSVVLSAFREAPPESKAIIVKTMGQRRSIPLEVVSLLMALAKDNTDRQLCRSACDAIYSSRVQPTYELLRLTVDRLGTDSISTTILDRQVSLPKEITDAVSKSLENPDLKMRNSAANALRGLESDAIIEAIARQLHNPDSSIRSLAIETLEREYSLPPFVLNEFYTKLKDTNEEVRTAASKALKRYRGVLPDNVAQAIAEHSKDPNDNATPPAAETPRKSPRLLEYLIQIFTKKDEHAGKEGGSVTFKSQKSGQEWTMGALQIIAKELEDSNPKIRISATKKLKFKTNLPEDIVQILAKQLEDSSATARDEAAEILSEQTALPPPLIQDLSQKLKGPNSRAWIPSLSALRKFVDIPDEIVGVAAEAITVHADRRDKEAKARLSAAIKRNSRLGFPKAMLKQVAKSRGGPKRIAWWTLVTSRANVKLPEPVCQAIIKLLENPNRKTRLTVLKSFFGSENFSVDLLAALTRIVEGDNVDERDVALEVLADPLPGPVVYTEALLIALLKHFNSSDTNIWQKAMDAVLQQATLPTSVADAIAKFCEESATTDKLEYLVNTAGRPHNRRCPEFLQHTLVKLLDSPDREIRAVAAESFLDRPPLVQSIISTLFQKLLDAADATIQSNIGRAIEVNWISNESMETMIKTLQGSKSEEDVKEPARQLLLRGPLCRRELPETILQFLGKQLRDPDTTIRRGAALLLCERRYLSIPVIQTVVENLSYLSGIGRTGVPRVLVEMPLLDDKLLTSTFESLHQGPFTSLFVQLRKSSFQWHLTWCVDGDSVSYLNSAAGTRTLAFESLKTKVEEAQKKNSVPPSVNWVEDGTELEESARTERTSLISLSGLARCVVQ